MNAARSQSSGAATAVTVDSMYQAVIELLDQQLGDFEVLRQSCEAFRQQVDRMLRPITAEPTLSSSANENTVTAETAVAEEQIRSQFAADFRDLLARIQQHQENLQIRLGRLESELGQLMVPPLNLTRFMQLLPTAQRAHVRTRRTALLDKLLAVRSIMVGSQLVLGYRLEFYQQLISALSGHTVGSSCYSIDGSGLATDSGTLIERDC